MSMITATAWVPRGYPAQFPTRYDINDAELDRISKLAKLRLDDAKQSLERAQRDARNHDDDNDNEDDEDDAHDERQSPVNDQNGVSLPKSNMEIDDDLKEYRLEHYDDDDEDANGDDNVQGAPMGMFGNAKSLAYYESNDDDPYITLKKDEDDDEERQELQILATDNLLLAAKVEDEVAHLEVYVYEDEADNLYVHHDIMLPAIPLCVEWLDVAVGAGKVDLESKGNFVAVGTFDPDIEIWNLDTVDCMYPNEILGQGGAAGEAAGTESAAAAKKKKKRKKSKKANDHYHVDAVLSLAHNRAHRSLLASSSADATIKLWDLNTRTCAKSYSHHTDKVCSIAWHPRSTTVLLSGSYDRTVVAADMRAPAAQAPRWGVESDVENVRWDPHNPDFFYVSTENGVLHMHDIRLAPASPEASKPVWRLQAHEKALSAFDVNPVIPGFVATGSSDKEVKLWNVQPQGPSMVVSRNLDVGKVFSTVFAPDREVSFRLAVAGSKGLVQIWDTSTNAAVRRAFAGRADEGTLAGDGAAAAAAERLIGVEDDDDDSSSSSGSSTAGHEGEAENEDGIDEAELMEDD